MTRSEFVFCITYSYYLEKMQGLLMYRIDWLISLSFALTSLYAISSFGDIYIVGMMILFLSCIHALYRPAIKYGLSREHAMRYFELMLDEARLSDDELSKRFALNQSYDSRTFQVLEPIAYKLAAKKLGLNDTSKPLSRFARALSVVVSADQ